MTRQQQIRGTQILDGDVTDLDISSSAGIREAKVAFDGTDGHEHDVNGRPTPAVLVVRQLRPTSRTAPDSYVHIEASPGITLPYGRTAAIAAQDYNYGTILPLGANKRKDLLYLDAAGLIQNRQGAPTLGTPVAPSYEGVLIPIAEIGPLTALTTQLTSALIKDVRPFIQCNPTIKVQDDGVGSDYVYALNFGTNLAVSIVNGVATLAATTSTVVPDSSVSQKGITKLSTNPLPGNDPVAISETDPRVAKISTALQRDGSVTATGDLNLGGHNLLNAGNISAAAGLTLVNGGVISTTGGGNITLSPSTDGKVRIESTTALMLPNVNGNPPAPNLGDIWYDSSTDTITVRTLAGPKQMAVTQVGVIGLSVSEVAPDPIYPPTAGSVGNAPSLDFAKDLSANRAIYFSFTVPEDALLIDPINVRVVYCFDTTAAGKVAFGFTYKATQINAALLPETPTGSGEFQTATTPGTANILAINDQITIPGGTLTERGEVVVKFYRASTSGLDTRSGTLKVLQFIVLYAKRDLAQTRNIIDVFDNSVDLGQVHTIKFQGNLITTSSANSIATIDISDYNLDPATVSALGTVKLSHTPTDPNNPIVVTDTAPYLPTQDQKDAFAGTSGAPSATNPYVTDSDARMIPPGQGEALLGTYGTPSGSNRYVTDQDPRIPTVNEKAALAGTGSPGLANKYVTQDYDKLLTVDQDAALVGTAGSPSSTNKFVTQTDPILPTTTQKAALAGSGVLPPSGTNKYVLEDHTNFNLLPTADQKAALVGSNGSPSVSNKYVTQSDTLLPVTGEKAALAGSSGTPSDINRYVTQVDAILPVAGQKDALAGSSGTPSDSNRYVTQADTSLSTPGQKAALAGSSGTPGDLNRYVTDSDPRIPTANEKAALPGAGLTGPSALNKYVLQDNATLSTQDQKNALEGSSGTPGAGNKYVTSVDARIPTQNENDALAGTGSPSDVNRYVTQDYTQLPTSGEKLALAGTEGTPSNINRYVTSTDTRVPGQDEKNALLGTSGTPSNSNRYVTNVDTRLPVQGQTDALTGSYGTPGSGNKFVTETDPGFVLTNGARPFINPIRGIDPVYDYHLATKAYVDFHMATLGGEYAAAVQALSDLRAVPPGDRVDKQIRLVEDVGAIYYFNLQASGGGEPPNLGPGQWYKIQASVSSSHNLLSGIQGGTTNEYYHFTNTEHAALIGGISTTIHTHTHANLAGLTTDDHLQYSLANGTRAFTGKVRGITTQAGDNALTLTTKDYVDAHQGVLAHNDLTSKQGGTVGEYYHATSNQNAALAGTDGTPSGTNKYVTNSDARNTNARTPTTHASSHTAAQGDPISHNNLDNKQGGTTNQYYHATSDQNAALAGTSGTPSVTNKFVTNADTRMSPATDLLDGLLSKQNLIKLDSIEPGAQVNSITGTGLNLTGQTLSVKYGTIAGTATQGNDTRVPSQGENDALVGTNGTPGSGNAFVTNSDPRNTNSRVPTTHASSHTAAQGDPISHNNLDNKQGGISGQYYHTTSDQNAALAGTSGTAPSVTNKFVDNADSRNTNSRTPTAHAGTHSSAGLGGTDPITHANLASLTADDHSIYSLATGTRAFTGKVQGVTTTSGDNALTLTTKDYVDSVVGGGGVTGSLTAGRVTLSSGTTSVTDDATFNFNTTSKVLTLGDGGTTKTRVTHNAGTLGSGEYASNTSATLANAASQTGYLFAVSAPNATAQGVTVTLSGAGGGKAVYASNAATLAGFYVNTTASWPGNSSTYGYTSGTNTGDNAGAVGVSENADGASWAVIAAGVAGFGTANAGRGMGVFGVGRTTSGAAVGGYFSVNSSGGATGTLPAFTSAALIANNNSDAVDIIRALDNNVSVFAVKDGGNVDFYGHQLINAGLEKLTSDPAGAEGRIYWNTNTKHFRTHDGTNWQDVYPGSGGGTTVHNNLSGLQGGTTNEYYHATSSQNDALLGTTGTPSSTNKYVTNSDTRMSNSRAPTTHAGTHSSAGLGGTDPVSHNNLANIQGGASGNYYHLTSAQQSGLTSGGVTTLHTHTGLGKITLPYYEYPSIPSSPSNGDAILYYRSGSGTYIGVYWTSGYGTAWMFTKLSGVL